VAASRGGDRGLWIADCGFAGHSRLFARDEGVGIEDGPASEDQGSSGWHIRFL
jgi:hypothetical protein